MAQVFTIGSINVDDVYRLRQIVSPGETAAAYAKSTFPGGKGANQSVAVARGLGLGGSSPATTAAVYHVGMINKADGQWIADLMHASGVKTDLLAHTPVEGDAAATGTGRAIIQVAASGENAIILYPGANHLLDPDVHFPSQELLDRQAGHAFFLFQNEISNGPAFLRKAKSAATRTNARGRRRGTVVFNPAPCTPSLASEFDLALVDILIVNEGELDTLTVSLGITAASGWQAKLLSILARFPSIAIAIVTLGSKGAGILAQGRSAPTLVPSLNIYPVDTTGAGDTFVGFFVAGLVRRAVEVGDLMANTQEAESVWDAVVGAVKVAAAAAAVACEREGAMSGIPMLEEVEERIRFSDEHSR
ncbi:Ribokinase-like protein, partial [Catenaria anguillulae PL171]